MFAAMQYELPLLTSEVFSAQQPQEELVAETV
jgi:hypothetical protein